MADGFNTYRETRNTELSDCWGNIVREIVQVPFDPETQDDPNAEGYCWLRRCNLQARRVAEWAFDIGVVSSRGGEAERVRREHQKVNKDAYARRHELQRLKFQVEAAQRWIENREAILQGYRPQSFQKQSLKAVDLDFRSELDQITDQVVYNYLYGVDYTNQSWMYEDPTLNDVLRYLRDRR